MTDNFWLYLFDVWSFCVTIFITVVAFLDKHQIIVLISGGLYMITTLIRWGKVIFSDSRLDNLEAKFNNLEAKVDNLEAKVDNLEAKVDKLINLMEKKNEH